MNLGKIKSEAKKNLKHNYFRNLIVVFICTILLSGVINFSTKNILSIDLTNKDNVKTVDSYNVKSNSEVLDELLGKSNKEKKEDEDISHKYTRGVLSVFVNEVASTRSVLFSLLNGINIFLGGNLSIAIIILISNIILILFRVFFLMVLKIGSNRYFLEERRYLKTNVDRLLFPYRSGENFRLAIILLIKDLKLILWSFTIIGFPIKYYEYSMIPYILAENPNIKRKDAFRLSKELMNGNKLNLFKLDLYLIGWKILGLFTFNLFNIFYTNVYTEALYTEFYAHVRENKYRELSNKELLDDNKLFIKKRVDEEYPEVIKKKTITLIDFNKDYSLNTYILLFFTFSFTGWLWEVLLHLVNNGVFVNRGTLYGPWLPIYGIGGVSILFFLKRFRSHPILMFLTSVILCGVIEYTGAWYLETFKHLKYWDYSGYFLNLDGRICLEGLIVFGLGGCGFTYIFAPVLDNIFNTWNISIKRIISVVLIILFLIDFSYSTFVKPNTGKGISKEIEIKE